MPNKKLRKVSALASIEPSYKAQLESELAANQSVVDKSFKSFDGESLRILSMNSGTGEFIEAAASSSAIKRC